MKDGDAEHLAFEQYGRTNNLDLSMHPLHLLYLDPNTSDALKVWKAAYLAGQAAERKRTQEATKDISIDMTGESFTIREAYAKAIEGDEA